MSSLYILNSFWVSYHHVFPFAIVAYILHLSYTKTKHLHSIFKWPSHFFFLFSHINKINIWNLKWQYPIYIYIWRTIEFLKNIQHNNVLAFVYFFEQTTIILMFSIKILHVFRMKTIHICDLSVFIHTWW